MSNGDETGSSGLSNENFRNQSAVNKLVEIAMAQGAITAVQGEAALQLVELYANMIAGGQVEIGESPITNVGIVDSWRGGNPDPYREPQALAVLRTKLLPEIHYSEQVQELLRRLGEPPIYVLMYAGVGDGGVIDRAAILVTYTSPVNAVAGQDELYSLASRYHPYAHFPTHSTAIVFNRDPGSELGFKFSHTTSLEPNIPTRVFVMSQVEPGVFQGSVSNMASVAPKHDGILAWEALFSGGVIAI